MGKSGKLKAALESINPVDYTKEKQKKLRKQAEKRKRQKEEEKSNDIEKIFGGLGDDDEDEDDEEDDEEEDEVEFDIAEIDDTDSSEDDEDDGEQEDDDEAGEGAQLPNGAKISKAATEGAEDEEEEDEEDIPYSDIASLASDERGDVVPYQRLTINNTDALTKSLARFALPISKLPFIAHQSITSAKPTKIEDANDDLGRELAFYAQSLAAVKAARKQLSSEGAPFGRPNDFFAEMVKSEEHMGRVRQRLVDDAAGKKASAEARRQRDLKKFGKAVQVAKLQERDKAKKETMEKINTLKRKRSNALPTAEKEADMFDIALDDETKGSRTNGRGKPGDKGNLNHKRQKKNEKYGFGGKKRYSKSGDAMSSADLSGFSSRKAKGGKPGGAKQRPGKARRAKARA